MRFHLVALPHTDVSTEHSACAFNQKVLKFAAMMTGLGHEVFLYSSEKSEAIVTEHIVCITEEERVACLNGKHYTEASFDYSLPHWQKFNNTVIEGIEKRRMPQDFICVIGGLAHKQIADAFPDMQTVEFGIGYGGVFSPYKVFESYAWMHTVYGALARDPNQADGNYFDEVIPNYFDVSEFPFSDTKDDYYLYIGRLTDRKGWRVAQEVCEKLGKTLVVAGPGEFDGYGEYVGVVDSKTRGELMSKARAVFVPTQYIEPFGSVHIEAMLCGTPVITTDWGAFTETVENGVNGFRCRSFQDYLDAARKVEVLNPKAIAIDAQLKYAMPVIAKRYEKYFEKLLTLWGDGWYNTK